MKKGFVFAAISVVLPILLFACGGGSTEEGSNVVGDDNVKPPAVPNAPIVSVLNSSSLRISWNVVNSTTSYKVFRNFGQNPISEISTTSYIDDELDRATTYIYTIAACNPDGCSANSAASAATTEYFVKDSIGRLIISDAEELAYIRTNDVTLADNYILTANIDLSAVPNWQPIGDYSNRFSGSLDGNGFVIQGVTTSGYAYSGLFGYMEGAVVRNLVLLTNDISSSSNNSFAGGLVGYAKESSISNSYALIQGNLSGFSSSSASYVGGLIGHAAGSDIENSYAFLQGNISSFSSGYAVYTGGLVGYANRSSISNSFAMVEDNILSRAANVASSQNILPLSSSAGGLAGYADNSFITNSYSIVQDEILAHSDSNSSAGGLIGYADNSTISNSYAIVEGNISTSGVISLSGGLVGGSERNTTISNSYYSGSRKLSEGSFTNNNGTSQTLIELRALNAAVTNAFAAATASEDDTGWDETIWDFGTNELIPILHAIPSLDLPRFSHISSSSLKVSWNRVIGASFYKVLRNGTAVATINVRSINTLVYSHTELGLEGGTSYSYVIRACNSNYCFAASPEAFQATKPLVFATSPAGYAEALDIDIGEFIFSSNSTDEWFGQTDLTQDDVDAIQSADIGANGFTCLATIVDVDKLGAGRLSYYLNIVSDSRYSHSFHIYIDGEEVREYFDVMGWTLQTHHFISGRYTVSWCYTKDENDDGESSAVFLDNFSYTRDSISPIPRFNDVSSSALSILWDKVFGATFYEVYKDGTFLADVTMPRMSDPTNSPNNRIVYSYKDIGLTNETEYSYSIKVCNDKQCLTRSPEISQVTKPFSLGSTPEEYSSALDIDIGLGRFLATTSDEWFNQTDVSRYDSDAVQSADIGDFGETCLASIIDTGVVGEGRLSYYFKVSSEEEYDYLTIMVNRREVGRYSGEVDWTLQTHYFTTGMNIIEWCYIKDGSGDSGSDAAFLDDFSYTVSGLISSIPILGDVSSSAINMLWNSSLGATFYEVLRDGVSVVNVTMPRISEPATPTNILTYTYIDLGLIGGTLYSYVIRACNNYACLADSSMASNMTNPPMQGTSSAAYSSALNTDVFIFSSSTPDEWFSQNSETLTGMDALQSAPIGHNGNTCLATIIDTNIAGEGRLNYYLKVSSEEGLDNLTITVNGIEVGRYSGELDWTLQKIDFTTELNIVEWCYRKNGNDSGVKGLDAAFLDNIFYADFSNSLAPRFSDVSSSAISVLWNKTSGTTFYEVLRNGVFIANVSMPSSDNPLVYSYTNIGLASNFSYSYVIRACNDRECLADGPAASVSTKISVLVSSFREYSRSLDIDDFRFSSTTEDEWFSQTVVTRDGIDALQSANIGGGEKTCLATIIDTDVTGPIQLSYYFKVSSEAGLDNLTITVDDVEVGRHSGEVDWTLQTHDFITGASTIKWCYRKNASVDANVVGEGDAVYLDNFSYTLNVLSPRFSQVSSTSLRVSWNRVIGATSYQVLRNGVSVADVVVPRNDNPSDNSILYSHTELALAGGTSYSYVIRACNNRGCFARGAPVSQPTNPFVLESSPEAYLSALRDLSTDDNTIDKFIFSSNSTDEWFNQTDVVKDGGTKKNTHALQSGAIAANGVTCLTTIVNTNIVGSGVLKYYFKMSSDSGNYYPFQIFINGIEVGRHYGKMDWTSQTHYFISGKYTIAWCYTKDDQNDGVGTDAVFLDQFSYLTKYKSITNTISGITVLRSPLPRLGDISSSALNVLWDEVFGASYYDVFRNGAFAARVTMPSSDNHLVYSYTDIGLSSNTSYSYTMMACDLAQCLERSPATSQKTKLFVLENSPAAYSSALDIDDFTFSSTTSGEWFNQTGETQDGVDALQSADIGNDEVTCLATIIDTAVVGSGRLSYYLNVSSEEDFDHLIISVDGKEVGRHSGEVAWTLQTHDFRTGAHTVEWCYRKDGGGAAGADAAYLDNFSYTVPIPSP